MSAPALRFVEYRPPGPVATRFMNSTADIAAIMGPVGSGKTSLCLMTLVSKAMEQKPSPNVVDMKGRPVRKFKFCVVRDTYRQLWGTTIKSWWNWMPKTRGTWAGSQGEPASHTVMMPLTDGTVVELIVEFVAIGDNKVEDVLRGYEVTAFYLNEADLLSIDVFNYAVTRTGRYPSAIDGGPTWHGVLMDLNAPDTESDLYKLLVEKKPDNVEFFVQPGGMDEAAENVANLPADYYTRMVQTMPEWLVRRMVHNQFGYSRAGKPVYPDFRDAFHVSSQILNPTPGRVINVGIDGGGSPAAVFNQQQFSAQWWTLDEVVTEQGTGPTRFGQALGRMLSERYRGFETVHDHELLKFWADPTAFYGSDVDNGENDWIRIVEKEAGIKIRPCGTNNPRVRQEAVRHALTQPIGAAQPGLLLSRHCLVLRKGYNSGYRFRKLQVPGDTKYGEDAEKNEWSHPHDANQYSLVGGGEYAEVMGRKAGRAIPRQTHAIGPSDSGPVRSRGGHSGPAGY